MRLLPEYGSRESGSSNRKPSSFSHFFCAFSITSFGGLHAKAENGKPTTRTVGLALLQFGILFDLTLAEPCDGMGLS